MISQLPVLIVGAGPTGLMMACELARHGIPFRIIDKNPQPTSASNATWVQARTLELLDQSGMVSPFLRAGHRCQAINLYVSGKPLAKIPLNKIDSPYPFILMLPQSKTEELLTEHLNKLNHQVERSLELVDVKYEGDLVEATLKLPDGKTKVVTSNWLIACDGASSALRKKCQIVFPGEDLTEQFVVADARIDSFMSKDDVQIFFDKGTVFSASPLGSNRYRITANIHQSHPRQSFYEKEVVELIQERGHGEYYATEISWISPFWIHGKIAKQFRHGQIFLMGDAAHVHSPLGGQGMNAGMQDAYNLAWKIALVVKGKAKSSLLDSYQAERYPVVSEIVKQSEDFTKMALFEKTFLTKLRKFGEKVSHHDEHLIKEVGDVLSQTAIQYQDSSIIDFREKPAAGSPQPGERAPDVQISKSSRLYDYLRNTQHNILLFAESPSSQWLDELKKLQDTIQKSYAELIKVHVVTKNPLSDVKEAIVDSEAQIFKRYQVNDYALYLVRPDNYIGLYAHTINQANLDDYMKKLF